MPKITMKCVDCGKESKPYPIVNFMQTKVADGEGYRCNKCAPKYYRKESNIVTYKCVDCGKEKTSPVWRFKKSEKEYRCPKCTAIKTASDPKWIETLNNRMVIQSIQMRERWDDPDYVEKVIKSKYNNNGFWYGHLYINKEPPKYCELFNEVKPKVIAFNIQTNNGILICEKCGKSITDNGHCHHVFYEKKTCCWVDEKGKYWTNLNARDHKEKDYYIGENPNYFVMLCHSCHSGTNGKFENRNRR